MSTATLAVEQVAVNRQRLYDVVQLLSVAGDATGELPRMACRVATQVLEAMLNCESDSTQDTPLFEIELKIRALIIEQWPRSRELTPVAGMLRELASHLDELERSGERKVYADFMSNIDSIGFQKAAEILRQMRKN
jgi:hypothetical protein